MTTHAETHTADHADSTHGHDGGSNDQILAALKFEPSELHDFQIADRAAGQMMGKLLAFLFCVLLCLMTGVNIWMIGRGAGGVDPQAFAKPRASSAHH